MFKLLSGQVIKITISSGDMDMANHFHTTEVTWKQNAQRKVGYNGINRNFAGLRPDSVSKLHRLLLWKMEIKIWL